MAKISKKEDKLIMSKEMLKNCKNAISKYRFSHPKYEEFLMSVKAMKDDSTVLSYKNIEMEKYREMFIKKHEHSLADSFQLEKFKIMTSDENGNQYETGWFAPRSFWDAIRNSKTEDF